MKVDTNGLAAAVDEIREGWTAHEDDVDHSGGILWTASECLRQIEGLEDEVKKKRQALRNVLMLAQRMSRRGVEDADHLIRFCAEGGVEPSVLRGEVDDDE